MHHNPFHSESEGCIISKLMIKYKPQMRLIYDTMNSSYFSEKFDRWKIMVIKVSNFSPI